MDKYLRKKHKEQNGGAWRCINNSFQGLEDSTQTVEDFSSGLCVSVRSVMF